MERLLDDVSFEMPAGAKIRIDEAFVHAKLGELAQNRDLSRYIL